jgi:hypothetical protein
LIYLDTSVAVSAFLPDIHSTRVLTWLGRLRETPGLSHWTVTEFSSAAASQERRRQITPKERLVAEQGFDAWLLAIEQAPVLRADFEFAREMVRRDQAKVRAPDALHLAVAKRLGARVATLDAGMAETALGVGLALEAI